jgi:FMN phosphatase YigB (HAD superfamily)
VSGSRTEVVLFDLGGVLFELGGVFEFGQLIGEESEERIWETWTSCPWVRAFECGECSASDFATGVVESLSLPMGASEFLHRFTAWLVGPFVGAEALVADVAKKARVGCVSNTNDLHWSRQSGIDMVRRLDFAFLSHRLGLIKPDRALFQCVLDRIARPPGSILFLDDSAVNVAAARALGFDAHVALGVEGAKAILHQRGLL